MRRQLSIAFLFCALTIGAQTTTIADLFKVMPDSLMPLLTQNNRLDMIDFMDAKMKARVTNKLEGESEMTALTADSLSIRMSSAMQIDLKLVPTEEEYDSCHQVIRMETVYRLSTIDATESRVVFFTTHWRPLPDNKKGSSQTILEKSPILKNDEKVFSHPRTSVPSNPRN